MAEIQFYHLLTTPLEHALPKLMEKALSVKMNSVIRVADEAHMAKLNDQLWSYSEQSFLPHGSAKDPNPEAQPIYITTSDENPNAARVLVITHGQIAENIEGYDKLLDIFDGHDERAVAEARKRWTHYKNSGASISYYQQQKGAGWKKMA